ncbi:glutamate 5-kinase [Brevibacillus ginsengisoli]|uniref:glutamate 5-kinase n=1 Tax=Brevibacillus ginsengisoli TaxID=363854 RepID=UPI003CE8DF93
MSVRKKRIVVKAGSSSLTNQERGYDESKLDAVVSSLTRLREQGHDVLFVSSGAVASGYQKLGYKERPRTLAAKQAAAAVGQSILMQQYSYLFAQNKIPVAQILLTRDDFSDRERYQHAFQTISLLLSRGVLPIINENDTVSVAELTFGDNDMLGALVSGLVHADLYIMLTDTNGFYDGDPRKLKTAKRIPSIEEVTPEMLELAGGAGSLGTGGMRSKLLAANVTSNLGIPSFIGLAKGSDGLIEILNGNGNGTYVASRKADKAESVPNRKQWIALHSPSNGKVVVDDGAADAILNCGRSLLPAGVKVAEGSFASGEVVDVYWNDQRIGRGICRYEASELQNYLLNPDHGSLSKAVIHRDDWMAVHSFSPIVLR